MKLIPTSSNSRLRTLTRSIATVLTVVLTLTATGFAKDGEDDTTTSSSGSSNSVDSPIQSKADPFGLPIVDKVQLAASDAASKEFQANSLKALSEFVNKTLGESKAVNDGTMLLDPSKLFLANKSDVRVYFIGEGAGFHNTLGFNTEGPGIDSGNPQIIFPDASSRATTYLPGSEIKRTGNEPLLPGDFVDLGTFKGGTQLDFFLIADGANKGTNVFSTDSSINPDGINHVVAFASVLAGSPYLIIGFEDMFAGGDRDFNDVLFAIDIGLANIQALTATPEPSLFLLLASFVGLTVWLKRRAPVARPAL